MLECEARYLLRMPLTERRIQLDLRERKRGKPATDQLRQVMIDLHQEKKMAYGKKKGGGGKK